MSELFGSIREFKRTVESFRGELKGDVKNLEAKMADGVRIERIQRKKDYDDLEAKTTNGFKIWRAKMEGVWR